MLKSEVVVLLVETGWFKLSFWLSAPVYLPTWNKNIHRATHKAFSDVLSPNHCRKNDNFICGWGLGAEMTRKLFVKVRVPTGNKPVPHALLIHPFTLTWTGFCCSRTPSPFYVLVYLCITTLAGDCQSHSLGWCGTSKQFFQVILCPSTCVLYQYFNQ